MYSMLNYGKIKFFMTISWILGFVWGYALLGTWFDSLRFGVDVRSFIDFLYLITVVMYIAAIVTEEYSRYVVNKYKVCNLALNQTMDLDQNYVSEFNVLNVGSVGFRMVFILSLLLGYYEGWDMVSYYVIIIADFVVSTGFTWVGYKAFKRMLTSQMFKDVKVVEL